VGKTKCVLNEGCCSTVSLCLCNCGAALYHEILHMLSTPVRIGRQSWARTLKAEQTTRPLPRGNSSPCLRSMSRSWASRLSKTSGISWTRYNMPGVSNLQVSHLRTTLHCLKLQQASQPPCLACCSCGTTCTHGAAILCILAYIVVHIL